MAFRNLAIFVVLTLGIAVVSRAEESPASESGKPATPAAKDQTKSPGTPAPRSPGDKKSNTSQPGQKSQKRERATFGAGCFWHVEDTFERLDGVYWAVSGYAGGDVPYPSYEMVHEGTTGHAEVVMVDFDPDVISYEDLLKVFWKCHDPTSLNQQGPDVGTQYRSVIFYHTEAQRRAALKSYRTLTDLGVYRSPIVTQLAPMRAFFRAEDYHQDYYGGKPRVSVRRRKTAAKVKSARTIKAKSSPAAAKPAGASPSRPASAPASLPKGDQTTTP